MSARRLAQYYLLEPLDLSGRLRESAWSRPATFSVGVLLGISGFLSSRLAASFLFGRRSPATCKAEFLQGFRESVAI